MRTVPAAYGLAVVRCGMGLYFMSEAYDKTRKGWLTSGALLTRQLRPAVTRAAPWYGHFLQTTALPHADFFARLVNLGEWGTGISLCFGLLMPVGALVGIFLNLNYMMQKGLPNVAGNVDRLFVASDLVMLLTAGGLVWGLDGFLWPMITRCGQAGSRFPSPRPGGAPVQGSQSRP